MLRYLLTIWFTTVTLLGPGMYYCGKSIAAPGLRKAAIPTAQRICFVSLGCCTPRSASCMPCLRPCSIPCRSSCQPVYPVADLGIEKISKKPIPRSSTWLPVIALSLMTTEPAAQSSQLPCAGPILCFLTGADYVRACHYLLC